MKKERNSKWTREKIFYAFDTFVEEHGRLPYFKEMTTPKNNLPTHSSVKNRFGITTKQFFCTYYSTYMDQCPSDRYHAHPVEFWIEDFKNRYEKMGKPTQLVYDQNRGADLPCTRHLMAMCGLTRWGDFLQLCGYHMRPEITVDNVNVENLDYGKMDEVIARVLSEQRRTDG